MLTVLINNTEYPLATTLRVAYKVQGQHNHKPYTEVFKALGEMHLEEQIGILYAAFECANPQEVSKISQKDFLDSYLDTYNIKKMMDQIQEVIRGIMGEDFFEEAEKTSEEPTIEAKN